VSSTNGKKSLFLALKITVSGLLLTFVLRKVGPENILSHLRAMDLRFFFLSSLIYLLTIVLAAFRWRAVLQGTQPFRKLLSFCLIGSFFNHFLPGAVGGDALKTYYLYKDTGQGGSSFGSVFMDRYIGYFALLSVGLASGFIAFRDLSTFGLQWLTPALFLLFLAGSLLFFGLRIGRRFASLADFYDFFHRTLENRPAVAVAFLLSIAIQALTVLEVYLISLGLNQRPPFATLFVFVPLISTVMAVPISISGLGLREGAFVLLFSLNGIPAEASTAISFLWFLSAATGSLIGLAEYIRYRKPSHAS
jgi:uncharacterized membrane protein YbhN (UPF0104 family)